MWRDFAIALSAANLCYLRLWTELLTYRRTENYVLREARGPAHFLAAIANVFLLAALLWAAVRLARRDRSGRALALVYAGFLLFLLLPLNAIRQVLSLYLLPSLDTLLYSAIRTRWLPALAAVIAAAAILLWRRPLARGIARVFLVFTPFVAVTVIQALLAAAQYNPAPFRDKPLAPPAPAAVPGSTRVLWIVFDEWDYRLTFAERDPSLQLPELDRFRRQAVHAANAYSPAGETLSSMPALITGRLVARADKDGADELWLQYAGAPARVRWSEQPNIFGAARGLGYDTALLGWFHPYCRVINRNLTECACWPLATQYSSGMGSSFSEILPNQVRTLFETTFKSAFGQNISTIAQRTTYTRMRDRAVRVAVDPRLGLLLFHFPVPHAPHFYNRATGRYDLRNSPPSGYLGSLKLVDNTLGDLRRAMDSAGLWESTTILLSADHSDRSAPLLDGRSDHRIPFLLKLAGQRESVPVDAPFNTVLTHDLLLAILRREVASPAAVVEWLALHRTIGDSPYNWNR